LYPGLVVVSSPTRPLPGFRLSEAYGGLQPGFCAVGRQLNNKHSEQGYTVQLR
jgi:hypothetical protein